MNAFPNTLEGVMLRERRPERLPLRRVESCSCTGFGADPECAVDHLVEGEQRQEAITARAAEKMADHNWLSQGCIEPLDDSGMWRLFLSGDAIEFCARLRRGMEAQAEEEAKHEIDKEGGR